jgi:hypothetical protein
VNEIIAEVGCPSNTVPLLSYQRGYLLAPEGTRMTMDEKADGKCSPAVLLLNALYAVTQHSSAAAHRN